MPSGRADQAQRRPRAVRGRHQRPRDYRPGSRLPSNACPIMVAPIRPANANGRGGTRPAHLRSRTRPQSEGICEAVVKMLNGTLPEASFCTMPKLHWRYFRNGSMTTMKSTRAPPLALATRVEGKSRWRLMNPCLSGQTRAVPDLPPVKPRF